MRGIVGIIVAASLLTWSTHAQDSASSERVQLDPEGHTFVAVSVPDIDRSIAWYSRFFELTETLSHTSDSGDLRIVILSAPGLRVELQEHEIAEPVAYPDGKRYLTHGVFKFGVYVRDLSGAVELLRDGGATIAFEPFEDDDGRLRTAIVVDDSGNLLQLFERR